jgi:phosphate transport system protein
LIDIGLERLKNMVIDMAEHSEKTVFTAINAFIQGKDVREQIFNWSEELRILQDEVDELAVELLARYQPVASDLRFIKSCIETAYGFSRFGRYAYDISQVLRIFGDLSMCDNTAIEEAWNQVEEMMRVSIKAFTERDVDLARKLRKIDDDVDKIFLDFVQSTAQISGTNLKCIVSATLILRYLERIADHATYVGDSVLYIVSGERTARK